MPSSLAKENSRRLLEMQPGRDKMRRRTPNRGNSVRARTFPRTTVVSRETLLKVESRDSFVDLFVGERAVRVHRICLSPRKIICRQSQCIFIIPAVVASCTSVVRVSSSSCSSRREFQIPSKWRVSVCSISLTLARPTEMFVPSLEL